VLNQEHQMRVVQAWRAPLPAADVVVVAVVLLTIQRRRMQVLGRGAGWQSRPMRLQVYPLLLVVVQVQVLCACCSPLVMALLKAVPQLLVLVVMELRVLLLLLLLRFCLLMAGVVVHYCQHLSGTPPAVLSHSTVAAVTRTCQRVHTAVPASEGTPHMIGTRPAWVGFVAVEAGGGAL
jgi:hypothetical protein